MSIDLSNKGKGVFYLNFIQYGDGTNKADVTQNFNFSNLVDQAGTYIIAIERLNLPLQRIPMINALAPAMTFESTDPFELNFTINIDAVYSWKEFEESINISLGEVQAIVAYIALDFSGRIKIYNNKWNDYNIRLSQTLMDIFDLPELIGINDTDSNGFIIGKSSIVDRFDQLHKIQVESIGMNVQQEILDTDRSLPIITDLIVPTNYSFSYAEPLEDDQAASANINVGYTVRQDLTYISESERRYVMLRGNTPIQNIRILCVAIFKDGSRNEIILPPRSVFECKIAFFRR